MTGTAGPKQPAQDLRPTQLFRLICIQRYNRSAQEKKVSPSTIDTLMPNWRRAYAWAISDVFTQALPTSEVADTAKAWPFMKDIA